MTLTCKTKLTPKESSVKFCFFKDGRPLSDCKNIPEFQINVMRKEDTGYYSCQARTKEISTIDTKSTGIVINVQRIPVSDVNLKTRPQSGQVAKGDKLILICSVAVGTGNITFSWYHGEMGINLKTKTQNSLTAEFEIPMMKESNSGPYYCTANNGHGNSLSELVNIIVRIPVSRPVLTFGDFRDQATVGDMVEFHCEAQRGSPPILYRFYHEDVSLGSSLAPSGGGVFFNISLTAEHSGNYSCEADNGLGVQQHSEVVILNVTVPMKDKGDPLPSGIIEGVLGIIVSTTVAILFCCWLKRKIGRRPARDLVRSPSHPNLQDPTYINSPESEQPEADYENANVANGNEVYSLVYQVQQERPLGTVESLRTHTEHKDSSAIYSRLKKRDIIDMDYEDAM
ncbi:Fc receptor-like protein 1 [Sorex fumeus]|uniref:Fc receptor-like protein 1 n=1 Tax=Sorex fumeus TaxID=62283 RepID=UPI0024AE4214|nr:Fc receptor-like protein 1 [Sorex fumeus]